MVDLVVPQRTLELPYVVADLLKGYAILPNIMMGALFYSPEERGDGGLNLEVAGLLTTGIGNPNSVQVDPQMKAILDNFLINNREYKFIDWRSYPNTDPIPSDEDYETFEIGEKKDPDFIGMIATDRERYIYPPNNPGRGSKLLTRIVITDERYYERERAMFTGLTDSALELGHTKLPDLLGDRIRLSQP